MALIDRINRMQTEMFTVGKSTRITSKVNETIDQMVYQINHLRVLDQKYTSRKSRTLIAAVDTQFDSMLNELGDYLTRIENENAADDTTLLPTSCNKHDRVNCVECIEPHPDNPGCCECHANGEPDQQCECDCHITPHPAELANWPRSEPDSRTYASTAYLVTIEGDLWCGDEGSIELEFSDWPQTPAYIRSKCGDFETCEIVSITKVHTVRTYADIESAEGMVIK